MALEIIGDYPGASLGPARVEGQRVYVEMAAEPPLFVDYAWHVYRSHFNFGLRNTGDRPLAPEVLVNGRDPAGRELPARLFAAASSREANHPADLPAFFDGRFRYLLRPVLAPGESLYLANTFFRPPDELATRLDGLAARGEAERRVYGHSLEGRELIAYLYRREAPAEAPLLLVTSGFHPPEPDTLASEAILEWLASPEGRAARRRFAFAVAPMANPDGFWHGSPASNRAGINLYWQFLKDDPERAPEARHLWELCLELAPAVYFDFHAYTFQLGAKYASPYLKPLFFYRGTRPREVAALIAGELLALTGGHAVRGEGTWAPSTLGSLLTERLNTITFAKYHLRLADGVEACREHGRRALCCAVDGLTRAGVRERGEILAPPLGGQRGGFWHEARKRAYRLVYGPLRHQTRRLRGLAGPPPGPEDPAAAGGAARAAGQAPA